MELAIRLASGRTPVPRVDEPCSAFFLRSGPEVIAAIRRVIEVWEKEWDDFRDAQESDPAFNKPIPYLSGGGVASPPNHSMSPPRGGELLNKPRRPGGAMLPPLPQEVRVVLAAL